MGKVSLLGLMVKSIKVINILLYNGSYIEDKKEGYGEFTWSDGRIYKGYWMNGK